MKLKEMLDSARTETSVEIRINNFKIITIDTNMDYELILTQPIINGEIDNWFANDKGSIVVDLWAEHNQ